MKYENKYLQLVFFRQKHPLRADRYGENHHVMMRSLCPQLKDAKSNIVRLSAAEHFRAHYYLWRAYKDELKDKAAAKKAWSALVMMMGHTVGNIETDAQLAEAASIFQEVRQSSPHGKDHPAYGNTAWNKGKRGIYSENTLKRMSDAKKGKVTWLKGRAVSDETRQKISVARKGKSPWNKGKKMSAEYCKRVSETHWDSSGKNNPRYGVHLSEETKRRIGNANRGKKRERKSA